MKHSSTPKLYHSIKEVGEMFDEEQHILRYWEREFDCLNPSKNRAGNRVYTEKDIRVLKVIKKLLRVDRLPVQSAKNVLKDGISETVYREAENAVQITMLAPSIPSDLATATESEMPDVVHMRKSDVELVIKLLHEVANQIEAL